MGLTNEHVGSKKPAKINAYILSRAELLITLCYEIPCMLCYLDQKVNFAYLVGITYLHTYLKCQILTEIFNEL